jgi:simple sugar transport system ATP-binding protein/ribose transport system ATP-binding protein
MTRHKNELEIVRVSKSFGGVAALSDVSLTIKAGAVHSLVGENGAGKSTLGKIISGLHTADSGEVILGGNKVHFKSPREALAHGIVTIAQELAIVPGLTVAENVLLGEEPRRFGFIRRKKLRKDFSELAKRVGFEFSPNTLAGSLSVAEQQKIEILRALSRNASIIIMDEPTAALSRQEAEALHTVIRNLSAAGTTVILVSHFLSEVLELSDTISVLRDGILIKTAPASECSQESLIELMLGRSLGAIYPEKVFPHHSAPTVLFVNNLCAAGVSNAWLSVRAGEILGIAGLVGSGRTELARAIFRDSKINSGTIEINGVRITGKAPLAALQRGISMLPESRKDLGLLIERSIQENITLSSVSKWSRLGIINPRREKYVVEKILEKVVVKSSGIKQKVSHLSGGNQQKVLLARTIMSNPRVLIVDEPTRGVDVGSKRAIYDLLVALAQDGLGIIAISSDLEEVLGIAHRVLVIRGGRIVSELSGRSMSEHAVLEAAFTEKS